MDENNKKRYLNARRENSIASLISAPLTAVSKANMSMLSSQTQFILNHCFKMENGVYQPIMVSMTISRKDKQGEAVLEFQVPLLSLLPLNSLAVENAKLNFSLDITTASSCVSDNDSSDAEETETILSGRIVHEKKTSENTSAHMKLELNANTIPIPNGMKTLIELYSKAILPDENQK